MTFIVGRVMTASSIVRTAKVNFHFFDLLCMLKNLFECKIQDSSLSFESVVRRVLNLDSQIKFSNWFMLAGVANN